MEPQLSTAGDLRQRRQRTVASGLMSAADAAGDTSAAGDAGDRCKLSPAVSAGRSLWVYRVRLCVGLLVILMFAWAYASYIKQLHETHLWFSNIQVRQL